MKQYKLLKDLPFAKEGDIFKEMFYDDDRILEPVEWVNFRHEIFVEELDNFDEWFEEIKETTEYFYINNYGNISKTRIQLYSLTGTEDYHNRKAIGNAFKTEEEAEKHLEWLKARAVLLEDMGEATGSWAVLYNWDKDNIHTAYLVDFYTYNDIAFECQEDAEASIKKHEKEWKIYLGIE